jgi:hypothetical protein
MALFGLYLVACGLLVVAGAAKGMRPRSTARALVPLLPVRSAHAAARAVRWLALFEAAIGVVGIVLPSRFPAAAVAASYTTFAVFVVYVRRRGGVLATCGCFSTPDTPPTTLHVIVDLALAGAAVATSVAGLHGTLPSQMARQPGHGIPLLAASAVCGWLTFLTLVGLSRLREARRVFDDGVTVA